MPVRQGACVDGVTAGSRTWLKAVLCDLLRGAPLDPVQLLIEKGAFPPAGKDTGKSPLSIMTAGWRPSSRSLAEAFDDNPSMSVITTIHLFFGINTVPKNSEGTLPGAGLGQGSWSFPVNVSTGTTS